MMKDNPFRDLTMPQLYAYIFKRYGEEGLSYVLSKEAHDMVCAHKGIKRDYPTGWRESGEDAAKELEALGLDIPARIIAEHAKQLPSLYDDELCPYLKPPYRDSLGFETNMRAWRAS